MTMNKQTVWLVTMLTLMVVLSAYYIVTGPVEPAQQAKLNEGDVQVDIKALDKPATATKAGDIKLVHPSNDYFSGYQIQRNTLRSKLNEEYIKIMMDSNSSAKEIQIAQGKMDQLLKVDKRETVLEDLIRKEGYQDAVVVTKDPQVEVVVQSDNLTRRQAVKLIGLVQQQMATSALNVSVRFCP